MARDDIPINLNRRGAAGERAAEGYKAMDERRAVKVMLSL
jgi:hypothetical protein